MSQSISPSPSCVVLSVYFSLAVPTVTPTPYPAEGRKEARGGREVMGRGTGGRSVPECCGLPPAAAAAITRRRQRRRGSHSVFIWTQIGITYFRAVNDKYRGGGGERQLESGDSRRRRRRETSAVALPFLLRVVLCAKGLGCGGARWGGRGRGGLLLWYGPGGVGGRGGLLLWQSPGLGKAFTCCGGMAFSSVARPCFLAVPSFDISPDVAGEPSPLCRGVTLLVLLFCCCCFLFLFCFGEVPLDVVWFLSLFGVPGAKKHSCLIAITF